MATNYILAIDPGAKGFLSVFHIGYLIHVVECIPIPVHTIKVNKRNRTVVDEDSLSLLIHYLIKQYSIKEIVIEKQRVQANEGVVSTGSTMQHFGWLKGFCEGKQIKKTIVAPKEWQSIYPSLIPIDNKLLELIKTFNKSKDRVKEPLLERLGDYPVSLLFPKEKSKLYCSYLFPDLDLKRTPRCETISDGKTDSLLIGYWRASQLKVENLKAA
jgi:hypothetical protein